MTPLGSFARTLLRRALRAFVALVALASAPARAAEVVATFGHWTVLRMTDHAPSQCSIATRSENGLLRLDLEPIGNGGLIVFASVTDGPKEPRAADDRVGISWQPKQGQMRVVTYPIAGSRLLPGPPVRLFVHAILRKPEEVKALLSDAFASASVLVSLDPGYDEPLPTAGFSDAWAALRACDPARTEGLPTN